MPQPRVWRYVLLVLGLAVLAWMVMDFNGRTAELNRLKAERDYVNGRYLEVKGTLAALETEVAYAGSDAAVVKWAYEEGHMVRQGDYPVAPIASTPNAPTPAPRPTASASQMNNTQSWLALFFDPKLP